MELHELNKTKNEFLKRQEIEYLANFDEGTPKTNEIQQEISKTLMVKKELVVISQVTPRFGSKQIKVRAHIYDTKEAMGVEVKEKKEKKEEAKKE